MRISAFQRISLELVLHLYFLMPAVENRCTISMHGVSFSVRSANLDHSKAKDPNRPKTCPEMKPCLLR
jgi:hypothetical protein